MWKLILKAKFASLKQAYHLEKTDIVTFHRIENAWHSWAWTKYYRRYKELRDKGHNDADAISIIEDRD